MGLATGEGEGSGEGEGKGVGLDDGDGLGVGLVEGLGEGEGLGSGVGLGEGLGDGEGCGVGEGLGWTTATRDGTDRTPRAIAVMSALPGAIAFTRPFVSTRAIEFAVESHENSTPDISLSLLSKARPTNCTSLPTVKVWTNGAIETLKTAGVGLN